MKSRTLFEGSHIPLHRWLQALFLFKASDGRVTAEQLHREIGVTCKTAYFIIERMSDAVRSQRFPDVVPVGPLAARRAGLRAECRGPGGRGRQRGEARLTASGTNAAADHWLVGELDAPSPCGTWAAARPCRCA